MVWLARLVLLIAMVSGAAAWPARAMAEPEPWTWDSLGNPLSESDNILGGNHLRSHGYDGRGLAVSDTLGMSATTSLGIDRVFDAMGRAVTITVKGDPKPLARWDYPVAPGASGTAALKKTLRTTRSRRRMATTRWGG
jgi:hypothetical protein